MQTPPTTDDLPAIARSIGVSDEAMALCLDAELIDLHLDIFIPVRLWGYDILREHRPPFGGHFFGHLDLPRMIAGGSTRACGRSPPTRSARPKVGCARSTGT